MTHLDASAVARLRSFDLDPNKFISSNANDSQKTDMIQHLQSCKMDPKSFTISNDGNIAVYNPNLVTHNWGAGRTLGSKPAKPRHKWGRGRILGTS